jgi:hypothetical protein
MATVERREAVQQGAKWLDERYPGWAFKIDRDTLDMIDNCILDQVVGRYEEGVQQLNGFSVDYGFAGLEGDKELWLEEIAERLGREGDE